MKVAIMQPYFLPYIGYWQLIASVDKFVILDDVNYINRGWINRNRIAVNGSPNWMTLPLHGASQNKMICELDLITGHEWRANLGNTVRRAYSKAPNFDFTFAVFNDLLQHAQGNLSSFLFKTITRLCSALGVTTEIVPTSRHFPKSGLKGSDRLIDICNRIGATEYINPPGGKDLYNTRDFSASGIALYFLSPQMDSLSVNLGAPEGASLSILHLLMHNPAESLARCANRKQTLEQKSA